MTIRGEGFRIPLDGQWKFQIEETWEGGRRPEISSSIPIAQQYVMNNSPVAELLRPAAVAAAASAAPAGRGAGPGAAPAGGRAGGPGRGGPLPVLGRRAVGRGRRESLQPDDDRSPSGTARPDRVLQLGRHAAQRHDHQAEQLRRRGEGHPRDAARSDGAEPRLRPRFTERAVLARAGSGEAVGRYSSSPHRPNRAITRSSARSRGTGSRCAGS